MVAVRKAAVGYKLLKIDLNKLIWQDIQGLLQKLPANLVSRFSAPIKVTKKRTILRDSTDFQTRLDNLVFRMGIAPSRAAARQLVTHCHIVLNGEICNIPSTIIKPGDIVGVRERSKSLEVIQDNISRGTSRYAWIEWDAASLSGKLLNLPDRTEIPENINEQLIVELYSK